MDINSVKIIADSSADLLSLDGISFENAPLKINTTEKEYVDDEKLDVKTMVDDLQKYKGRSFTSCPNTADWLNAFGDAQYIFCVTITSTLSGSYNSACLAKKEYEASDPHKRVHVIDSKSTGPEMHLIIEKLRELIENNLDFDTVCAEVEKYMQKTGLLFMLQSMKNLANNGRVSHVAAKMAGILGIRALGKASDRGDLEMLEKCRGERNSLEAIINTLKKLGYKGGKIRISHCFNENFGNSVKEKLIQEFGKLDVMLYNCRGLCSFYAELGGILIGFEKA